MPDANRKPLEGKVALITGSGQNIGRRIAEVLAADGATVIVNGRRDRAAIERVAGDIRSAGGSAMPYLADVSDAAEVAAMIEAVGKAHGGIDIAVSNAGLRRQTPFLKMDFAEWREILAVALDGAFLLAKAVVPGMIARGGGAFVGMSGISHHAGARDRVHVNASKAGLEGLIRGLAMELAPHKITVNAVAPGLIDTVRGAAAGGAPADANRTATIPLRRAGTVDEIAAVVRLLVGPEGSYITGQTIHVNGGSFLAK
jgi:3-oxoacyl-[acyl-carrier protein] reductase